MAKKIKEKTLDELAEEAIDDVFSDTSVSRERTIERLQDLIETIRLKIASLGSGG